MGLLLVPLQCFCSASELLLKCLYATVPLRRLHSAFAIPSQRPSLTILPQRLTLLHCFYIAYTMHETAKKIPEEAKKEPGALQESKGK